MDLKQLLEEQSVQYVEGGSHRNVREGWVGLDCPWCGTVGKYHLAFHVQTLRGSCWQCGGHSLPQALSLVARISIGQALDLVKQIPKRSRTASQAARQRGRLLIPPGLGRLLEPHRRWLRGRELDPEHLEQLWDLQGFGVTPQLGWRLWIPVYYDREVVSWTTRSIGTGKMRWIHAPPASEVFPIKTLLYGWDYVRGAVIVVEGPSDVWRIGPGAVAMFGMIPTMQQIHKLASVPRRVVCLDRGTKAQQAASSLARQLQAFPGETIVAELESDDPGSATNEEVAELRKFLE